jgi:hypothetical protein
MSQYYKTVLPRDPVCIKAHVDLTYWFSVTTGGNQSTQRKPVVFGVVKLEAFFSHVTEVKL